MQGSSVEKHIIRLLLCYKYSNKILIHPGSRAHWARCEPVNSGRVERGWSLAVLLLAEALPVPRVAAACGVIPILPNPWSWRLAVSVEQCHCCHSAQFTRLKWAIWCVSPSSVVCWSGRMDWMFSAELWWKKQKIKHSLWFQHLSYTFPFHWTSWTGRLYSLAQKYFMLLYILFAFFWFPF